MGSLITGLLKNEIGAAFLLLGTLCSFTFGNDAQDLMRRQNPGRHRCESAFVRLYHQLSVLPERQETLRILLDRKGIYFKSLDDLKIVLRDENPAFRALAILAIGEGLRWGPDTVSNGYKLGISPVEAIEASNNGYIPPSDKTKVIKMV